ARGCSVLRSLGSTGGYVGVTSTLPASTRTVLCCACLSYATSKIVPFGFTMTVGLRTRRSNGTSPQSQRPSPSRTDQEISLLPLSTVTIVRGSISRVPPDSTNEITKGLVA